jgi:hypothetical protein
LGYSVTLGLIFSVCVSSSYSSRLPRLRGKTLRGKRRRRGTLRGLSSGAFVTLGFTPLKKVFAVSSYALRMKKQLAVRRRRKKLAVHKPHRTRYCASALRAK